MSEWQPINKLIELIAPFDCEKEPATADPETLLFGRFEDGRWRWIVNGTYDISYDEHWENVDKNTKRKVETSKPGISISEDYSIYGDPTHFARIEPPK